LTLFAACRLHCRAAHSRLMLRYGKIDQD